MTTARDVETVLASRYTLTPAGEAALAAYLGRDQGEDE